MTLFNATWFFLFSTLWACQQVFAGKTETTTITIISKRASCSQGAAKQKLCTLSYFDDVHISFSDGSNAHAQRVVIEVSTAKTRAPLTEKKSPVQNIQKITLSENVSFFHDGREAYADQAIILPNSQQCTLAGKVRIVQNKVSEKDLPVEIRCSSAAMDLISGKMDLMGSTDQPVLTSLILNKTAMPHTKKHTKKHGHNKPSLAK